MGKFQHFYGYVQQLFVCFPEAIKCHQEFRGHVSMGGPCFHSISQQYQVVVQVPKFQVLLVRTCQNPNEVYLQLNLQCLRMIQPLTIKWFDIHKLMWVQIITTKMPSQNHWPSKSSVNSMGVLGNTLTSHIAFVVEIPTIAGLFLRCDVSGLPWRIDKHFSAKKCWRQN